MFIFLCCETFLSRYPVITVELCVTLVKVLGGSSSLNAMIYVRGHREDFDRWEREGATGWSYRDCLPYFRRSQTHELGGNDFRGMVSAVYAVQLQHAIFTACDLPLSIAHIYMFQGLLYIQFSLRSSCRAVLRKLGTVKNTNLLFALLVERGKCWKQCKLTTNLLF